MKNKLPKLSNKYIYLNNVDIIKAGDEYWSRLYEAWLPQLVNIGQRANIIKGSFLRRKLTTKKKTNKNQPNVRRYTPQTYYDEDNAYVEMDRDDDGSYVNYEDYLKLYKKYLTLQQRCLKLKHLYEATIKHSV